MRIYRIKKNKEDVDDCFNCENLFIIDAFKIRWKPATIFFRKKISGIDSEIIFKMAASMDSMQK